MINYSFDIYFVTFLAYFCHTACNLASGTNTFETYASLGLFLSFCNFIKQIMLSFEICLICEFVLQVIIFTQANSGHAFILDMHKAYLVHRSTSQSAHALLISIFLNG